MKISQTGIDLVKSFEGLRLKAYLDSASVWTIGYGHTRNVSSGQVITEKQAEEFLLQDLGWVENCLSRLIETEITQSQYDALCSFVFNIGESAFAESYVLKYTNERKFELIESEFMRWVYAGGKILAGLQTRRAKESQLYMKESMLTDIDIIDEQISANSQAWNYHKEQMELLHLRNTRLRAFRESLLNGYL